MISSESASKHIDEAGGAAWKSRRAEARSNSAENPGILITALDPGGKYPAHPHIGVEQMYILSGELIFDDHTLYAGDFEAATAGHQHAAATTKSGYMVLVMHRPLTLAGSPTPDGRGLVLARVPRIHFAYGYVLDTLRTPCEDRDGSMSFRRIKTRALPSIVLALAFLVQMAAPAFSQSSYSVMACCKRSKANCCCHTKETPGVAKLKSVNGCQGPCRFGSLSAPLDTSFAIEKTQSPKLQLVAAAQIAHRRLAAHSLRFDVTRYQRPPPESL